MRLSSMVEAVGNTPHLRLARLFPDKIEAWMKLECFNPSGSIKDRPALRMVSEAERAGLLRPGSCIIEPTSGNMGVALALVCAVKGYRLILVMPEGMSLERRRLFLAYGAEFELTPRELGMKGSIERANKMSLEIPGSWIPSQFENQYNVSSHAEGTALEIIHDFPDGLDYFIAGVGTGGHLTGCARVLKEKFPDIKIIAVEPYESQTIGGGIPRPHHIQGIGPGFIPGNLQPDLIDQAIPVDLDSAFAWTAKTARLEGALVGISSGACISVLNGMLPLMRNGARAMVFAYDTGERYLSVKGLFTNPF